MISLSIRVLLFIALLALPLHAQTAPPPAPQASAPVTVFNRQVALFRVPLLGTPAEERALRANNALRRMLAAGGPGVVTAQPIPQGYSIMLDGMLAFMMSPEDADSLNQETPDQAVKNTVTLLELVVRETREARNLSLLLRATGFVLAATVALVLLIWLLNRVRNWLTLRLTSLAHTHAERLTVGGESLMNRERLLQLVQRGVTLVYWVLVLFIIYDWLGFSLGRFPYTRPWGERLTQYLLDLAVSFGSAIARTVPNLLVAFLIFLIAKFIIDLLKTVFERVEQGKLQLAWLDQDTVCPTRRLVSAGIWLFALVMAYPYLPGSGTEAFKGLSVLIGLMVSLGASSLVGQAASGLILMYTRTIRAGEYVQISGNQGTVMELGLFTTRIRTGLGEELTLPNALILGNVSRNYSRTVQGNGFILETGVTIGYDTPWRQVHAMLIEAAGRTPGVQSDPAPRVFQTALSDYYPEYRLACQVLRTGPTQRAEVLSTLHGNIQDVFNEYGVQIMSPHYLGDPAEPKVVPKEQWFQPPAEGSEH
jgi:small-conductance mechanosensitive channel